MDTVHRNCARVSETEFVETGAVRWDIPRVDAAIALHCPGKYVSLKNIQYFDAFPYVGYSWNSYLLEQYVATVSKNFTLMHSSIPSGQYLNYSRIESGQFNTSVVGFELPGDFYTFRITSGRPSTNLLFKTIQIRKWLS